MSAWTLKYQRELIRGAIEVLEDIREIDVYLKDLAKLGREILEA